MQPLIPGIVVLLLLLIVFGAPAKGDDKDKRKGRGGRAPHIPPMGHGGVSIVINNGELVDRETLEPASGK